MDILRQILILSCEIFVLIRFILTKEGVVCNLNTSRFIMGREAGIFSFIVGEKISWVLLVTSYLYCKVHTYIDKDTWTENSLPIYRVWSISKECKRILTLPIPRLLLSKEQGRKDLPKPSKPWHVGIHWKALAEHSQMSTICQGFSYFSRFYASFCFAQISQQ